MNLRLNCSNKIAQIQRMEPGKLCIIGQGPNGPYYNLQCREEGKTLTRYVPVNQAQLSLNTLPTLPTSVHIFIFG